MLFISYVSQPHNIYTFTLLLIFPSNLLELASLIPVFLSQSQRSTLTLQPQQNPLPATIYNTMMIPQQNAANVVQIATSLAQNAGPNAPAVATFAQEHAAQIRFDSLF